MKIAVVVITCNRLPLLPRALTSIAKQNRKPDFVFVVSNSTDEIFEAEKIICNDFGFALNKNLRTPTYTGALNSSVEEIIKHFGISDEIYFASLDDDDEWLPDYLQTCKNAIKKNENIIAVFCQLIWRTNETDDIHELTIEKLTQENFYIGNPGVQGSNTFINSRIFNELNGFDESFPNSNDRELMIRLLDYIENENNKMKNKLECKVIEIPLVVHYNHTDIKVNTNFKSKKVALDFFYKRYKNRFSEIAFQKSIARAKKYFHYDYEE